MTIEERAKDFAGYNNPSSQGIVTTTARMIGKYEGFKAGAEWMMVKATAWLVAQGLETNDGAVTIRVKDFVETMEE